MVVVGHSLAFRAMMATFAGPAVDPAFGAKKLSNCGVAAVDFDFAYAEGSGAAGAAGGADAGADGAAGDGQRLFAKCRARVRRR